MTPDNLELARSRPQWKLLPLYLLTDYLNHHSYMPQSLLAPGTGCHLPTSLTLGAVLEAPNSPRHIARVKKKRLLFAQIKIQHDSPCKGKALNRSGDNPNLTRQKLGATTHGHPKYTLQGSLSVSTSVYFFPDSCPLHKICLSQNNYFLSA